MSNSLPPLRTAARPADTPAYAPVYPNVPADLLQHPRLTQAARDLIAELVSVQLLDPPAVRQFLADAADRLPGLTSKDRVAHALAHAKLLSNYQRDRVIIGQTFGLVLGNYRVLERIGGGTVGVVFLAEHLMLRRRVAVKVVPVDDTVAPEILERFHAEMRVLAGLNHPHIVAAYDAGVANPADQGQASLHYLVLELVPGGDLEDYVCRTGRLPVDQAAEWGRQAAGGLQAAHDHHLIHRDLKPSNLLLTTDAKVKLVDFGLARQFTSNMTRAGSLIGSLEFMAPEQSLDPTAVGPPADVYGLGATLFWSLTGELPLPQAKTAMEMLRQLRDGVPRRVRQFRQDIPEDLDAFLDKMLARDPEKRPTAVDVMGKRGRYANTPSADLPVATGDGGAAAEAARLRAMVRQLEASLTARDDDVREAHDALLSAMAKMAESTDGETHGHLHRMQEYVLALAERLYHHPDWPVLQDSGFVEELMRCVPLHDIGKIGVSDAVLAKRESLTPAERAEIERHTLVGSTILDAVGREHGASLGLLPLAKAVVRHHHERWDGTGYPDRLAAARIPPAARLVAVADVYDALRRDRPHRPGKSHPEAAQAIVAGAGTQFDPTVVEGFRDTADQFESIYDTIPN